MPFYQVRKPVVGRVSERQYAEAVPIEHWAARPACNFAARGGLVLGEVLDALDDQPIIPVEFKFKSTKFLQGIATYRRFGEGGMASFGPALADRTVERHDF